MQLRFTLYKLVLNCSWYFQNRFKEMFVQFVVLHHLPEQFDEFATVHSFKATTGNGYIPPLTCMK